MVGRNWFHRIVGMTVSSDYYYMVKSNLYIRKIVYEWNLYKSWKKILQNFIWIWLVSILSEGAILLFFFFFINWILFVFFCCLSFSECKWTFIENRLFEFGQYLPTLLNRKISQIIIRNSLFLLASNIVFYTRVISYRQRAWRRPDKLTEMEVKKKTVVLSEADSKI